MHGNIALLQLLVDLGMDVNESKDRWDPDDPFCLVEGPICLAASEGQLATVRWLLEHGARIDFVVQGQPRCLPLTWAATAGHLDIVKLLVEHGANIQGSWCNTNALMQAEGYGRQDVRDYLLNTGACRLPQEPSDSSLTKGSS